MQQRWHGRAWSLGALTVALAATAAACGSSASPSGGTAAGNAGTHGSVPAVSATTAAATWPVPEWTSADPAAVGLDPDALEAFAGEAEASGSNCLVVTKDGHLVGEWYWNEWNADSTQGVFSTTKSVTAALVGIAEGDGLLTLDDPASTWITEWQGTASEDVSVRNLLSNDSGRHWDFESDYVEMAVAAPDKTGFAVGLGQQHEPGAHWEYNNSAIQTLEAVLEGATDEDVVDFAHDNLFEPIGSDAHLSHDASGNAIMYSDMVTSCRDLARFGLLWLRGGEWNGEQLVPAAFVAASVEPSQDLNPAYGYLWWRNGAGSERATRPNGQPVMPKGEDALEGYAALGLGDQVAAVFPEHGLVITRIASVNVPADSPEFGFSQVAAGAATLVAAEG